jgi:peptide/nickel transport system substrate-binding protein
MTRRQLRPPPLARATRPRLAASAVVTVLALVLAACSAGQTADDKGSGGATGNDKLTVGLVAEPASLDFTTVDGAAIPQALLNNVYDGLVKLGQDGDIQPDLATSWKVSADRKTYTFQLVDDATFTNGKKFTAADAVFSIERVQKDWTISLKAAMDVVASAKAVSPTQLQVTLKQPSNDWLYRMTTRIGAMFSRSGVGALATKPVGTGPYTLGAFNRGDSLVLRRNSSYWGKKPFFATVTLKYFKDATALNNALITGTIDVIGTVQAPESLGQLTSNAKFRVIEGVTNGEVVLSFNNSKAPFNDKRVRQAVRYAIDHKALLDTCWAGRGTLIGSMVPPTDPWYQDLTNLYPHDPAKAKSLLRQAGKTALTVRLRLPSLPYAQSCGQVVKSQLAQVGINARIDTLEFPAQWLQKVFTDHDYDMSIVAHVEPHDMAAVFGNPDYYTQYDNPAVQKLLTDADSGTPAQQTSDLQQAARALSEDAAADWLFLLPNLVVAEKDITGLPKNAIGESFDLSRLARS